MKKLTALFIYTALAALMSPISSAYAEWKELGSNAVMVVYVDLDTIRTSIDSQSWTDCLLDVFCQKR
jgi:hypothetical protein